MGDARQGGERVIDLKKVTIAAAILSSALLLSACNLYKGGGTSGGGTQQQAGSTGGSEQQTAPSKAGITVTLGDSGFEPTGATVAAGETITWINKTSSNVQIASDPHPVHTSNKELTNGQFVLDLAPGASLTVAVAKTGTWGYHDHLNPGVRGKVTVQ